MFPPCLSDETAGAVPGMLLPSRYLRRICAPDPHVTPPLQARKIYLSESVPLPQVDLARSAQVVRPCPASAGLARDDLKIDGREPGRKGAGRRARRRQPRCSARPGSRMSRSSTFPTTSSTPTTLPVRASPDTVRRLPATAPHQRDKPPPVVKAPFRPGGDSYTMEMLWFR